MAGEPSKDDPANLELSPAQMQAMGEDVVRRAVAHLSDPDAMPIRGDYRGIEALCRSLREGAPEQGAPLDTLLDPLFDEWIPRSFSTQAPGYMAYIPGGGVYPAALADFIADAVNRYTGVWQAAPALVQLEANALEWLRDWMQFPPQARGLFTTGGSMAIFNAIACAREKLLGADIRSGTLYVSSQAHHCIVKAAKLAGIARDRVRTIDVDEDFRLRVDALQQAIDEDRRAGLDAVHGVFLRRYHQHRRSRSHRRGGRPGRTRAGLASRRRRLRWLLPHGARLAAPAQRLAARRFADP